MQWTSTGQFVLGAAVWVKPAGVVCDGYRVIFMSVRR